MDNATAPHAKRLLWAGFFSIFAAGVGFSVRAGILPDWAAAYGFTNTELGGITGGGLIGFGIVIILGSLIADRIGYGSPSHFTRDFKRRYGLAPGRYATAFEHGSTVSDAAAGPQL